MQPEQTAVQHGQPDDSQASVPRIIHRMKAAIGAKTDNDLSRHLEISKVTVASWRRRKQIPYEYCRKISDESGLPMDYFITGNIPEGMERKKESQDINTYLYLVVMFAFEKFRNSVKIGDDYSTILWWSQRFTEIMNTFEDEYRQLTRPGGMKDEEAANEMLARLEKIDINDFVDRLGGHPASGR